MYALKDYMLNDILNIIDGNVSAGNITLTDASKLRNLLRKLYKYLYSDYEEFIKEGINDMIDEGLVLEMDIIEYNHKKELQKSITNIKYPIKRS